MRREMPRQSEADGESAADAALAEYLQRTERGERVDRQAFLVEHADVAAELTEYFDATDEIDSLLDLTFPEEASAELGGGRLGPPALSAAASQQGIYPAPVDDTPARQPTKPPAWGAVGVIGGLVAVSGLALLLFWPAPTPHVVKTQGIVARTDSEAPKPRRGFVPAGVEWDGRVKPLAPRAPRLNKLVGSWNLMSEEPAADRSLADLSGLGHIGQIIGGPQWHPGGLEFDGVDDCIALGNPPQLDFEGAITLAAWVLPQETSRLQNVVAHGHEFAPPSGVFLRISAGKYQVGSWDGADHLVESAIPAGDLQTWVHLCGVYDGAAWKLYRQGELAATRVDPRGSMLTPGNWAIGATGNLRERFFRGRIRQVQIYDRALTEDEVRKIATE